MLKSFLGTYSTFLLKSHADMKNNILYKGSSINDVTVLGEEGVMDFVTTVLSKALVLKHVTMGGGGSKIVQNSNAVFCGNRTK